VNGARFFGQTIGGLKSNGCRFYPMIAIWYNDFSTCIEKVILDEAGLCTKLFWLFIDNLSCSK
jgi:hypothetical protein